MVDEEHADSHRGLTSRRVSIGDYSFRLLTLVFSIPPLLERPVEEVLEKDFPM